MLKKSRMKLAARRLAKKQDQATKTSKATAGFWSKTRQFIRNKFRALKNAFKKIWNRIRKIDLISLINLVLLAAIIILFSVLILNVCNCDKKTVVFVASEDIRTSDRQRQDKTLLFPTENSMSGVKITLPLKKDTKRAIINRVKPCEKDNRLHGDIIVDGKMPKQVLSNEVRIQGNLYLQNMRKYTLPCDMHIDGNLFLRDVDMLQFCGDFVITGNIYVSRRSSFGPIPRTARLGGQIIF